MLAAYRELDPDPTTRSLTVPETRISPGSAECPYPSSDVDRQSAKVIAPDLALARVQSHS